LVWREIFGYRDSSPLIIKILGKWNKMASTRYINIIYFFSDTL
jgi:hypothetical protein